MDRSALIITDLGYGDSGKGALCDALVRRLGARLVVRSNGGAQAAHNVVTADGRQHTFAQLGAGSFVAGARTHLSRFMLVNPLNLFTEVEHLESLGVEDLWQRLTVDRFAPITTPFEVAANRLYELARGDARHGSCGLGIGETVRDLRAGVGLRAGDLLDPAELRERLHTLQDYKRAELAELVAGLELGPRGRQAWDELTSARLVDELCETYAIFTRLVEITDGFEPAAITIFEGAQGVLLDERYGFHPHTTWSKTTPDNARELLAGFDGEVLTLALARTYMTRHGAGPLVTEDAALAPRLPEAHNTTGPWQGQWRVGWPDLVALRYAASVCGQLDGLALSFCDAQLPEQKLATAYADEHGALLRLRIPDWHDRAAQEHETRRLERARAQYERVDSIPEALASGLDLPLVALGYGQRAEDRVFQGRLAELEAQRREVTR